MADQLKKYYKNAKNTVLQVPEIEKKVKEATSNEKWGPSGTQMREIAQATHSYHDLPTIMSVIWKRLNDPGKFWRHVYKSLLLIDYLLRNGAEQVTRECRANVIQIQTLTEFQHIDEQDKDVGLSVRERAKAIVELLHDEKRLKGEREKAKANAKKYTVGIGSDTPSWYSEGSSDRSDYRSDRSDFQSDSSFSRNSSRRQESDEEEEEEEEKPKPKPQTQTQESAPKGRPRAPSFDAKPASAAPTNLFDFDDTPTHQSKPQTGALPDFFASTPAVQNMPTFTDPFKTPQSNDFFDPRGTGMQAQQPQSGGTFFGSTQQINQPSSSWADFDASPQQATNSSQAQQGGDVPAPDEADPWNKKHLFDLDLNNKKTSSNTSGSQPKTPMGQLGSTPMSSGPKPMGTPNQNVGRGQPSGLTSQQLGIGAQPVGRGQPLGGSMGFGAQPIGRGQPVGGFVGNQPVGGFIGAQQGGGFGTQPMGGFVGAQQGGGFGTQPMGGFVGAQQGGGFGTQQMGGFVGAQQGGGFGAQPMGGFVGAQQGGFGGAQQPGVGGQMGFGMQQGGFGGAQQPMGRGNSGWL